MKAGRKAVSDDVKRTRGTHQPCRTHDELEVSDEAPTMPDYLSPEAKKIWAEELPRVLETKVSDTDSSLFARYCSLEALVRQMLADGVVPTGNLLTELRRMGECLGLTGPSSRITSGLRTKETNEFVMLGMAPRGTN